MALTTYSELKHLPTVAIDVELNALKKQLFELRLKRATKQHFKPHLLRYFKRKIAQLQTLKSERICNSI